MRSGMGNAGKTASKLIVVLALRVELPGAGAPTAGPGFGPFPMPSA